MRVLTALIASLAVYLLGSVPPVLLAAEGSDPRREEEAKLLGVLASDASLFDKAKACQRLAVVGSTDSVTALAKLLGDPELGHYARFALEPVPDPSADEALRAALGRLDGKLLIGAVNSIGVRRDLKAVEALSPLLVHGEGDVVAAAADALGRIGSAEATAVLSRALEGSRDEELSVRRAAVAEGMLLAADLLGARGESSAAVKLYDAVRRADVPRRLRHEATRGAILARGRAGIPLLVETLRSEGFAEFALALGVARELSPSEGPSSRVDGIVGALVEAMVEVLGEVAPERRALLLGAIAERGGAEALPALLEAARSPRTDVRLAAVKGLGRLGDPTALPVLLEAAVGEKPASASKIDSEADSATESDIDSEIAREAAEALSRLHGEEVDERVLALLASSEGRERTALLEVAGRRRMAQALPAIREAALAGDEGVRLAAIAALGEAMGSDDVTFLAERLLEAASERVSGAVIAAIEAASRRTPDRDGYAARVIAVFENAPAGRMVRFFEALRAVGGAKASEAVAARAKDPDPGVRRAAIDTLGTWMDEAGPRTLLDFVKECEDPQERLGALRGWSDRVRNLRFSKEARLAHCREGLAVARGVEEKAVAIQTCRGIPAAETMDLVIPYLEDPALKETACEALAGMSHRVLRFQPEAVVRAMRLVLEMTSNEETEKLARQLLRNAGGLRRDPMNDSFWTLLGPTILGVAVILLVAGGVAFGMTIGLRKRLRRLEARFAELSSGAPPATSEGRWAEQV